MHPKQCTERTDGKCPKCESYKEMWGSVGVCCKYSAVVYWAEPTHIRQKFREYVQTISKIQHFKHDMLRNIEKKQMEKEVLSADEQKCTELFEAYRSQKLNLIPWLEKGGNILDGSELFLAYNFFTTAESIISLFGEEENA